MNCDQVFDILTRGPFPTGTSCDEPVEAHLSACPECHRLAEALRPAVELFQEAVDPEESRDLPGYWCSVSTERQSPALSYAREIEPRALVPPVDVTPVGRHYSALAVWRMAAMVAIGVTAGTLLATGGFDGLRWPTNRIDAAAAPLPSSQPQFTPADRMELASLPGACFGHEPEQGVYGLHDGQLLASANLENLNCCSGCHNAASDRVPSSATLKVSKTCQHCHTDQENPSISAR